MAKVTKNKSISATVTDEEKVLLDQLDSIIEESRAEFIRRVVIREARKLVNRKGK